MIEVSSSSGNMELSYNWCALLMIWLLIGIEMWVDIWYSLLLVGYSLFFVYVMTRGRYHRVGGLFGIFIVNSWITE